MSESASSPSTSPQRDLSAKRLGRRGGSEKANTPKSAEAAVAITADVAVGPTLAS